MRLKILLQSNWLYLFAFIFLFFYIFIKTNIITYESVYKETKSTITGEIIDYSISDTKLSLTVMCEEVVVAYYYFDENEILDLSDLYGREVTLIGEMYSPNNNTVPNTFNYKNYLYQNKIFYLFDAEEIILSSKNFDVRNIIVNRIENLNTKSYILLFILGDKSELDDDMYSIYQDNGVAHLLAISGLHINLFVVLLEFFFRKVDLRKREIIIFSFLIFYSYLTSFAVSVLRCVIFYILKCIITRFDFEIKSDKILFLTALILLLYNPFYIYGVGFLFSFTITYFLIILKPLKKENYFISSLRVSFIALLASLPITASMNYEINLSSVVFNLVFVPFVSFIVFPLSLLTFIFPFLDKIFEFFLFILEFSNSWCYSNLSIILNIPLMHYYINLIYYAGLYFFIKFKKRYFIIIIIALIFNKLIYKIDSNYYVYYMDIGQGDCSILVSPYQREIVMIDTGGNYYYNVSDNVILFLKSIGITSIDLLVISHGDSDHALDAENIYNNLKVDSIMFNDNEFNELEMSIRKLNIIEVDSVDLLYFQAENLNSNIDNENDASIVLYFNIFNYDFLFSGDIGTDPLTSLVDEYDLKADFYKVSHHGSSNNTNDYIISKIHPKYAFISAGKNNIYNHPSDEVIETLYNNNVIVYQTPINGTIKIKISENDYNIYTFPA